MPKTKSKVAAPARRGAAKPGLSEELAAAVSGDGARSAVAAIEPGRLDWELVEIFVVVAEAGGVRQAQRQTGLSLETLRRRVVALEERLGKKLFRRANTGLKLTEEGRKARETALAARQSIDALSGVFRRDAAKGGLVSVSAPEGIGIFWLTPRLKDFKARYPEIVLDFSSTMRLADINQHEADITIQYQRPSGGNLKHRRLGALHVIFYCSPAYERIASGLRSYRSS